MSFAVWPAEGRWQCFGKCAAHGDVVDLLCRLDQISIAEAAIRLTGSTSFSVVPGPSQLLDTASKPPYELTRADRDRMATAAHRLACDPALIANLCRARPEWNADAIRQIALEGELGYEQCSILFGYSQGIKRRWKDGQGNRRFAWICGGPHNECWRQSLLLHSHRTIYICEGETDAITLASAGAEKPGVTLVIALASGTSYPDPAPFAGKRIIIVPDLDQAGERCAQALRARLSMAAESVERADYGGVDCD
jgi:hypothetical protein